MTQIDDKLNALADCVKKGSTGNISQLCSDWWELTDEDDYTVSKFMRAFKDEKLKRDIK